MDEETKQPIVDAPKVEEPTEDKQEQKKKIKSEQKNNTVKMGEGKKMNQNNSQIFSAAS